MTKIIGLTGGIGSGKTTVAKYIQSLGIPVYIADDEAKKVLALPETILSIRQLFGAEVFDNDKLSTEKLGKAVFNNPENLKQLNQIIHPAVKRDFDKWLGTQAHHSLVVKEAAILFESGSYKSCDFIITVTAPLDIRIQRIMARDQMSMDDILNRIKNQWTDEMRVAKSDYVVENLNINEAKSQIDQILKKLTIQQK